MKKHRLIGKVQKYMAAPCMSLLHKKIVIFFACACACAMSAAHASEYTITVADADRDMTADELFAITNAASDVTRVVKNGAKALSLRVPMPDYKGSWTINNGDLRVYAATNGVGAAGDGTDEIYINRTDGGSLSLYGTVIEKPIRVTGATSAYCIYSRNNATNWITRSITGASLTFVLNAGTKLHTQGGIFCTGTVSMNAAGSDWYWEKNTVAGQHVPVELRDIAYSCGRQRVRQPRAVPWRLLLP